MKYFLNLFSVKRLLFMNLGVVVFFCLLIIDWYLPPFGLGLVFSSVFSALGNMLMIPILFLAYPGLLVLSIIHCIHEKFRIKSLSFWSFFILLTFNPFFVKVIFNAFCK